MAVEHIQIQADEVMKEEEVCDVCKVVMTNEEVYFKDGIAKINPEEIKPENIRNYCRDCVVGSPELTEKSNHMIRWFVWLMIKDCSKEEKEEMQEALLAEKGEEEFKLIADLFEVESFYKVVKTEEKEIKDISGNNV